MGACADSRVAARALCTAVGLGYPGYARGCHVDFCYGGFNPMISADDIEAFERPKLLILGYARHGKDTVAEILARKYGFRFTSSSEFVGREIIWDDWGKRFYPDFNAMFADRVNHRELWMEMIRLFNTPDKTRAARTMLSRGYDMYVGMRRMDELAASRHLFDYVIWVERAGFPPETGSMDITKELAKPDYVIHNGGTLEELEASVDVVARQIM
jgi:hypothetical protein